MSRDTQLNLWLLFAAIILSLIAWIQPGLEQHRVDLLSNLKADDIHNIIIERQGLDRIKLEKRNNSWFLLEPYTLPANILRVNTLTALAEKRSYLQFQVQEAQLARYKLDQPPISVWLNNSRFILGSEDPINQQRYAMNINANQLTGQNTVHLINGTVYYQLRAGLDTFIATALLPPKARIEKITWNGQSLSHQNGQWHLSTDNRNASPETVAQFLQSWQQAQASRVETNSQVDLSNSELIQSQTIQIQLTTADNQPLTIDYIIIRQEAQIKLLRADLKIAYWITPQLLKLLTEFVPVIKKRE